ncbi:MULTISPECIES: plasmid mobilization protein [Chitinophagaceae]
MKTKTRRIDILVSEVEHILIAQKAKSCELPISHFLIQAARNVEIKMYQKTIPSSVSKVILSLFLSANNFNQLVRHLHSGVIQNISEEDIRRYADIIIQLAKEIKSSIQ